MRLSASRGQEATDPLVSEQQAARVVVSSLMQVLETELGSLQEPPPALSSFLEMRSWLLCRKLQGLQSCVAICVRPAPVQECSWWHFYKLLLGTEAVVCSSNTSWVGGVCPISLPAPEAVSRHRFGVQFTVYSLYQVTLGMVRTRLQQTVSAFNSLGAFLLSHLRKLCQCFLRTKEGIILT